MIEERMNRESFERIVGEVYAGILRKSGTCGDADLELYAEWAVHAAEVVREKIEEYWEKGEEEEEVEVGAGGEVIERRVKKMRVIERRRVKEV